MKLTEKLKSEKGSSSIEAALVFPILILIICGVIKTAIALYGKVLPVEDESLMISHAEMLLRGRWAIF